MPYESGVRLSLSGFLFEDNYAAQSLSLEDFCRLARQCGYAAVELRQTQIDPYASAGHKAHVYQLLASHGLRLTCLTMRDPHPEGPERDESLRRYLGLCCELECPLLKVSGSTAWLNHAANLALPYRVRLATNNHIGNPTETIAGTDTLLGSIGSHNFGLLFDPMHLALAGQDPATAIRRWAPRIFNVLFQCVRRCSSPAEAVIRCRGSDWAKCHPAEIGAVSWPIVAQELVRSGYDGWVTVIENGWPHHDRRRIAAEAADFLRNIFPSERHPRVSRKPGVDYREV